ncbi:hypothetical protein HH303_16690 [Rhodospirillaceae bacterium KN72]|uniref:Aa3-type cytochrome c oxidase subunit IV n=1 Tax=Pacificispira spongiicola TaxID=2729598 RepID=A0A7Y0HHQ8_9PROT|nr:hypothetical protein [Pacificispira spongiicola]NMM46132.1 hypothetical protein [Pacificispira spongiicola]
MHSEPDMEFTKASPQFTQTWGGVKRLITIGAIGVIIVLGLMALTLTP